MPLQFNRPNINSRPYDELFTPQGFDALFDTYQRGKMLQQQQALQGQQLATERGKQLLDYGFDPAQVTPEVLSQAQSGALSAGAEGPSISPIALATQQFLERKKRGQTLGELKIVSEIEKNTREQGGKLSDEENKLRSQLQELSKSFFDVRDSYNRIEASANNPSAAGDLALIFNYMKILDPKSVVREGEFANAQNTGSIPQIIWASYNRVLEGERLSPGMRGDFLSRSRDLFESQRATQSRTEAAYMALAERLGLRPENVVLDLGSKGGKSRQPAKSAEARYDELIRSGIKEDEVYKKLAQEGY